MNENGVVRSRLFFLFLVFRFLEFGPVSVTAEILATAKLHALISVGRLSESGHTVILNKENPRIKCPNGEIIKLRKRNKMFVMDLWIKRAPLAGQ